MSDGCPDDVNGRASLVEQATGATLVLGSLDGLVLPATVTDVVEWRPAKGLVFESIVSLGFLGRAKQLGDLLDEIKPHMCAESVLYFHEPTSDAGPDSSPPDVTAELWANGFTPFEVHRHRARRGRHITHECWGRARLQR